MKTQIKNFRLYRGTADVFMLFIAVWSLVFGVVDVVNGDWLWAGFRLGLAVIIPVLVSWQLRWRRQQALHWAESVAWWEHHLAELEQMRDKYGDAIQPQISQLLDTGQDGYQRALEMSRKYPLPPQEAAA